MDITRRPASVLRQHPMTFTGKRRWDSVMGGDGSPMGHAVVHGGSAPNLLTPSHSSQGSSHQGCPPAPGEGRPLEKRRSMEVLRSWAPDLGSLGKGLNLSFGSLKWPSLVGVGRWKQSVSERLLKRHCGEARAASGGPEGPASRAPKV